MTNKYSLFNIIKNVRRYISISSQHYSSKSSSNYCLELVKKCDHENFLCTLLLPPKLQSSAIAIRAFNIEIARIQEQISDEKIGQMRVRFWRDCLEGIYSNKPPEHPVAIEVHKAVTKHNLTKRYFTRLIMSRAGQLNLSTFKDKSAMLTYAEQSTSSIYLLLLEVANLKDEKSAEVAKHIGIAQGITNFIRGLFYNVQQNIIMLPQELLAHHNVSEEQMFRANLDDNFRTLIWTVAQTPLFHLEEARSLSQELQPGTNVMFLPAVTVSSYLKRLKEQQWNPFSNVLFVRNPFLPFSLWWYRLRNKY